MMERWTMEQLERTDDLDFAICILNERRNRLNPYSPLAMKLRNAARAIEHIKEEKDLYLSRIIAPGEKPADAEPEEQPLPTIREMAEDGYDIGDTCRECINTYGSPCCTDLNPHLEYDETTGEDTEGGSECGMLDENRQGYEKYKRNGGGQNG